MMTTRPSVFKEQKGGQLLGSSVSKGERPKRWAGLLSRALWPSQGFCFEEVPSGCCGENGLEAGRSVGRLWLTLGKRCCSSDKGRGSGDRHAQRK